MSTAIDELKRDAHIENIDCALERIAEALENISKSMKDMGGSPLPPLVGHGLTPKEFVEMARKEGY